jgi:hypothetical protein
LRALYRIVIERRKVEQYYTIMARGDANNMHGVIPLQIDKVEMIALMIILSW